MTAQNGVNTALTRPGRVFPRPFTHGEDLSHPHMGGGDKCRGTKALMGGLMRGDIDLMEGEPNFDRLYHKLKVLLMLSCNYTMQFIGYDSIKLVDLYFIAFNGTQ